MSSTSTTLPEATEAIYQRWRDEWVTAPSVQRTPYCFDNDAFTPPPGPDGVGLPWARVTVRHGGGGQETLGRHGNRKFLRQARVFVQLFVAPNTGRATTDDLLHAARAVFEGRAITGTTIRFKDVITPEMGEVDDGRWWGSTCEAAFEYDEIK